MKESILDYQYEEGTKVEVEGRVFHALITWLEQLEAANTEVGYSRLYSKSPKEIKDDDGTVLAVELTHVEYPTLSSYMNQKPVKFTSMHGVIAADFYETLGTEHLKNIKKGVAKKLGTVNTETPTDEPTLKLVK